MKFYLVKEYGGELIINPDDSVEEMMWLSRQDFEDKVIKGHMGNIIKNYS